MSQQPRNVSVCFAETAVEALAALLDPTTSVTQATRAQANMLGIKLHSEIERAIDEDPSIKPDFAPVASKLLKSVFGL